VDSAPVGDWLSAPLAAPNVFAAGCSLVEVPTSGGTLVSGRIDAPGVETLPGVVECDLAVVALVVGMRVSAEENFVDG
jgi:hypothetical protein